MKKYLWCLFIGSLCLWNGYAQDLRIHVKSGELSLPFAYVLVNGKYRSAADSAGVALIPKALLKTGDSISGRYIGAQGAFEIFRGQDELTLDLPGPEIGSVVVLSKTDRKNLWRNINWHKDRKAYQKITCRFEIYTNVDTTHVSSGRMKCWIYPSNGEYDIKSEIDHLRNDANFSRSVLDLTRHLVNEAFVNLVFSKWVATNKGIRILKENRVDGLDVYTILRPAVLQNDEDLTFESTKIFVDPATKNIVKSIEQRVTGANTMLLISDYRVTDDYYVPYDIRCSITPHEEHPRILYYRISDLQLDTKRDKTVK